MIINDIIMSPLGFVIILSCLQRTVFTYNITSKIVSSSKAPAKTVLTLNNGRDMPIIGFGTAGIKGDDLVLSVLDVALAAGYRLFDTAQAYENEEFIGKALQTLLPKHNLERKDIFITSKLNSGYNRLAEDQIKSHVQASLDKLKTPYIDLFLIHWPGTFETNITGKEQVSNRHKVWKCLVDMYNPENGPLKAIGVSNFIAEHIADLIKNSKVIPAVNQVEFHPHYLQPQKLINICNEHKIALQAYSSLGHSSENPLIKDSTIEKVAKQLTVTPAQVLLRWGLQENFLIIPKSVSPERIKQNIQLDFALSPEQVEEIESIPNKKKYIPDPETIA